MLVCDVIIVSTIGRMLHAVAVVVIMTLYAHCWSWASLCCVRKLLNLSQRQVNGDCAENPDYEMWKEQILSGIGEDQD